MKPVVHPPRILAISLLSLLGASTSWGLGFRNPDQNARATAQGEAFVAQADDASAIYYNPAGLTQVKGTQVTSGLALGFPRWKYDGAGGSDEMNTGYFLPHLYAASDLSLQRWRFGIGLNYPFGNQAEYGANSPLQYGIVTAELSVLNIAPTVAYQITPQLSLGVALNIYYGQLEQQQNLALTFGGGRFKFEGDGTSLGATLGLLWKPHAQHAVGLTWRSPFEIEFDDSARLRGNLGGDAGPSDTHATLAFPQSLALGYAYWPRPNLKLEFDIEWTNWDTLNDVRLHSANPFFDANTNPLMNIPFDWQDSFFYELGVEYRFHPHWTVSAGYIFSENSVPDRTFSPAVPDSDRHIFSIGLGFGCPRLDVQVTYQYSHSEDRTVTGSPAADGEWQTANHAVLLSSTWKF
jgi:long-chain fatty acid transport protein